MLHIYCEINCETGAAGGNDEGGNVGYRAENCAGVFNVGFGALVAKEAGNFGFSTTDGRIGLIGDGREDFSQAGM